MSNREGSAEIGRELEKGMLRHRPLPSPSLTFGEAPFTASEDLMLQPLPDTLHISTAGNVTEWSKNELTEDQGNGIGIGIGDGLPIAIYLERNKPMINATIYDEHGRVAAKIKGNKLSMSPLFAAWQKNDDRVALEIVDDNLTPVFQVQLIRQNTLVINGMFWSSDMGGAKNNPGMITIITSERMNECAAPRDAEELAEVCVKLRSTVKRIFRYPAILHRMNGNADLALTLL